MCLIKEKREALQGGMEPIEFLAQLGMGGLTLENPFVRDTVADIFSGEGSQAAQAAHEHKPIKAHLLPPRTREALIKHGLNPEDITVQARRANFNVVYQDENLGYEPSPEDQLLMRELGEGEEV